VGISADKLRTYGTVGFSAVVWHSFASLFGVTVSQS
jgi:hypothetical protein